MATAPKQKEGTLFWKVAALLIAVQVITGVLAVGFTAWFARDQQLSLASVAITARLDAVSEEIERRSTGQEGAFSDFSDELKLDLSYRFPDPMLILGLDGSVLESFHPADDAFSPEFSDSTVVPHVPDVLDLDSTFVYIVVDPTDHTVPGGYATAPLYDAGGFPIGLLLVQPLTQSLELELSETDEAFKQALRLIAISSLLIALALGAFLTWWLVRPLRRMASRVGDIGEGAYEIRLAEKGNDEFASLSKAINLMTERVQLSFDTLRESDRMRRELVANVGHDLRTPLAAVQANLEEAERLRSENRDEEADDALVSARKQSMVLASLINDLFELSRLESNVPRLHTEPILFPEIISDAISAFKSLASESGIDFTIEIEPNLPIVSGDGTRILRLLNNLISNALRFAPRNSSVVVSASRHNSNVIISVADSGKGIAPEALERLFDRYYRGTDARTRSQPEGYDGTGLGLAIAKAIAEAHGGSLTAMSTLGKGTTFVFKLPVAD